MNRLGVEFGDATLRKALLPTFPALAGVQLVDYKARVAIESRDGADVQSTVGVSENVVEASWLALADAIEYKLFKDQERPTGGPE